MTEELAEEASGWRHFRVEQDPCVVTGVGLHLRELVYFRVGKSARLALKHAHTDLRFEQRSADGALPGLIRRNPEEHLISGRELIKKVLEARTQFERIGF
jgi:hypothetical protein